MDPSESGGRSSRGRFRTAWNLGSVLSTNVIVRATSFVVYAIVARQLGVEDFGRLALAASIFQLLSRLTVMGVDAVVTRDIARAPASSRRAMAVGSATVLVGTLLGTGALVGYLSFAGYPTATDQVIMIVFAGAFPYSISQLLEATFLGWERASLIAATAIPVNVVQAGVAALILGTGGSIADVAWSISGAHLVLMLVQFVVWQRRAGGHAGNVKGRDVGALMRASSPFLGVRLLNTMATAAPALVLSQVASEVEVGIYSAAGQLLVPFNLIAQATARAIYPVMARRYEAGVARLREVASRSVEAILTIVVPAAAGLAIIAEPAIELVFGTREFSDSVDVLRIIAFVTIAGGSTSVLGQILWASNRELTSLWISAVRTTTVVSLAIVLSYQYGVAGTAIAVLATSALNAGLHVRSARRAVGTIGLISAVWRPALATVVMAVSMLALPGLGVFGSVAVGLGSYLVSLMLFHIVAPGSLARSIRNSM